MSLTLNTNFVRRHNDNALVLFYCAFLLGITLLTITLSIFMGLDKTQQQGRLPQLQQRLAHLSEKRRALSTQGEQTPSQTQIDALNQRVARLSQAGDAQAPVGARALMSLERLLPARAQLVSLRWRRKHGELEFTAQADDKALLTTFLQDLEDAKVFREVLLTKQRQLQNSQQYQFEFRLTEASP